MTTLEKNYPNASYLAQVRRLRQLAQVALSRYDLNVSQIDFIKHGENTTFKISTSKKTYLLRIHRNDYHTQHAIEEEMLWLKTLAQKQLCVPKPVFSKAGEHVVTVSTNSLHESRNCTLLEWVDGRFITNSLNSKHMYKIGILTSELHNNKPTKSVKFRNYWNTDGLLGRSPTFGQIHSLKNVTKKEQVIINTARELVFKKLKQYEKSFPKRIGLIHADLHFGNLVQNKDTICPIDFDDCGVGFYVYDLAVTLISAERMFKEKKSCNLLEMKDALITGYTKKSTWDDFDEKILSSLASARHLSMLGWLNSRFDNPRLKNYFPTALARALEHLKHQHRIY